MIFRSYNFSCGQGEIINQNNVHYLNQENLEFVKLGTLTFIVLVAKLLPLELPFLTKLLNNLNVSPIYSNIKAYIQFLSIFYNQIL